jgi:hypothetical protein
MERKFEIGDEFKFRPIKSRSKWARCLDPDKTFTIHDITRHGSIKYYDKRTNRKCKCCHCRKPDYMVYNYTTGQNETDPGLKSCMESEIVLVRTRLQRQREISLSLLNIF